MSIVMNLYYTGTGNNARRFAEEMESSGTADRIRKEPGNARYEYFLKIDQPETVLLIDEWENQEALDRHHSSPMMKTIIALREKYHLTVKAERYVTDENGIPEEDLRFIKK
ncbi:MAG: antibiotic biosynthesis monooxygenase [Clostridia bacterium]|nr:antibiotic biosynthesis monooxygenase [Clostridia bacterium]